MLTKTAAPEPVTTNDTVTYTLTISNLSSDPALNVTLADPLPAGVTFVVLRRERRRRLRRLGQQPHRHVRVASPVSDRRRSTITATVTAGMGATLVNTATVDVVDVRRRAGEQHGHRDVAHAGRQPERHRQRRAAERLGDALRPRSELPARGDNGAGGDPDGDGRTNFQELQEGSHPRGFVITYLAEGATGTFFDTRIALANPTATTAARAGPLPEGRRHRRVGLRGRCCRSAG